MLLLAAAIINEGDRSKPLLYLDWMGSAGILRFAAVAGIAATTRRTRTECSCGQAIAIARVTPSLLGAAGCTARPAVGRPLARAGEPKSRSATVSLFQALGGGWT